MNNIMTVNRLRKIVIQISVWPDTNYTQLAFSQGLRDVQGVFSTSGFIKRRTCGMNLNWIQNVKSFFVLEACGRSP